MKIIVNGVEYVIKEVYSNKDNPTKPKPEIPAGMKDSAIFIEADNFDYETFSRDLKREKILTLKLV